MTPIFKRFDELTTTELYEIAHARTQVFLLEQKIICQDFDRVDYDALHCFLWEDGKIVAYLRAYLTHGDTAKIGRVLSTTHGVGLGSKLMQASLAEIERRWPNARIALHAQTHAKGFYERFGFVVCSEEFLEEGVPHVEMTYAPTDGAT